MLKKCVQLSVLIASIQVSAITWQSDNSTSALPTVQFDSQSNSIDNNSIDTFVYDFESATQETNEDAPAKHQTELVSAQGTNNTEILQRSLDFTGVKKASVTVDYSQQFVSSVELKSLIERQNLLEQKIINLEAKNTQLVKKIEEISTGLLYNLLFNNNEATDYNDSKFDSVIRAEDADQITLTLLKVESLINTGEYGQAVEILNNLLIENPNEPRSAIAWYWLAECNYQLEKWGQAEQAFAYLVATFPQHWRVPASIYKIGRIAEKNNDTNKARTSYLKIIQNYPKSSVSLLSSNALQLLQHNTGR